MQKFPLKTLSAVLMASVLAACSHNEITTKPSGEQILTFNPLVSYIKDLNTSKSYSYGAYDKNNSEIIFNKHYVYMNNKIYKLNVRKFENELPVLLSGYNLTNEQETIQIIPENNGIKVTVNNQETVAIFKERLDVEYNILNQSIVKISSAPELKPNLTSVIRNEIVETEIVNPETHILTTVNPAFKNEISTNNVKPIKDKKDKLKKKSKKLKKSPEFKIQNPQDPNLKDLKDIKDFDKKEKNKFIVLKTGKTNSNQSQIKEFNASKKHLIDETKTKPTIKIIKEETKSTSELLKTVDKSKPSTSSVDDLATKAKNNTIIKKAEVEEHVFP